MATIKDCTICGTSFETIVPKLQNYCSERCKRRAWIDRNRVPTVCPTCNNTFDRIPKSGRKYCSPECRRKAFASGANRQETTYTEKTCPTCGKPFLSKNCWPSKFCSWDCCRESEATQGRDSATCLQCKNEFTYKRSQVRKFCSIECWSAWASENFTGENSPTWTGGDWDYNYGPSWEKARREARKRDKACLDCGKTRDELGYNLHVHHVIPFRTFGIERHKEANDLSNLECVCNNCHGKRKTIENQLYPYVQILSKNVPD